MVNKKNDEYMKKVHQVMDEGSLLDIVSHRNKTKQQQKTRPSASAIRDHVELKVIRDAKNDMYSKKKRNF